LSTSHDSPIQLRKILGLGGLILFGLIYLVPLTVFTTFGVASLQTGGRTTLAYFITLVAMLFTAHSYAAMSRVFPVAGSTFTYASHAFGIDLGFAAGWALLLDYLFMPMLNYLVSAIFVATVFPALPQWVVLTSFLTVVTALNLAGIESLHRSNMLLIVAQILFVLVFLGLGLHYAVHTPGLDFALPLSGSAAYAAGGVNPAIGLTPLLTGAAVLCLSFLGFDAVSAMSEDARDAKRDVPRAILGVTLLGGVCFIALSYVAQLVLPTPSCLPATDAACTFGDDASLLVMKALGGDSLRLFFLGTYVAACLGSALTAQASVSRILFSMGRMGVLPGRFFGKLSPRRAVPVNAILCVSALSLLSFFIDLTSLASMISFGALVAFSTVNLAAFRHFVFIEKRRSAGQLLRYGLAPLIGAALSAWLWTSLQRNALMVGLGWLGLGVAWMLILKVRRRIVPLPPR
jgi:amino acid transporter